MNGENAPEAFLHDRSFEPSPEYRDALYLAGFERVWAYTQGITLAQLARQEDPAYRHKAQGLARYLCQHAVHDGSTDAILGWPFSWNTLGDNWKDARLVTGANAWAIHGLGVFLASKAYDTMPEGAAKHALQGCYRNALEGLKHHKRSLVVAGRDVVLMTAGWTTEGLALSNTPHQITTKEGALLASDPHEAWAYYSVLDAIGYDLFAETHVLSCVRDPLGHGCDRGRDVSEWRVRPITDEAEWTALRRRIRAENVVTEHNLDVLSVLNHALLHGPRLGLPEDDLNAIIIWRNRLRDGIFSALYDTEGWKPEFRESLHELQAILSDGRPLTQAQHDLLLQQRRSMETALAEAQLGRVVTGGVLVAQEDGGYHLLASEHTAIDNCSWLSLSVDHRILSSVENEFSYVDRLAACLEYTTLQFIKDLPFGKPLCDPKKASCPPLRTYRGTHYFQNAFRDPYIEPSTLQESSYHLEATMGLVLGLLRFAEAHPGHPSSERFLVDARGLWSEAQRFIQAHNFPYSSQRIQDLSALLSSSTAMVWFIDVHDALHRYDFDPDRPLRPYHEGLNTQPLSTLLRKARADIIDATPDEGQYSVVQPPTERALVLMATVNLGRWEDAEPWGASLLPVLAPQADSDPSFNEDKLYSLIALLFFLEKSLEARPQAAASSPESETDLFTKVYSTVGRGLDALDESFFENHKGALGGLIRTTSASESGVPLSPDSASTEEPSSRLDHNVLAYFVFKHAMRVLGDQVRPEHRARLETLETRLFELCGLEATRPPATRVLEHGPVLTSAKETYAVCALYAAAVGRVDAAIHLVEATAYLSEQEEPTGTGTTAGHRLGVPWLWLARRAVAPLDPRQDEIVLMALTHGPTPKGLGAHAGLLLVDQPGGVFGVPGASLTAQAGIAQDAFVRDASTLDRATQGLAGRYLDVISTILASDFQPARFDAQLGELAHIRKVHDVVVGHQRSPLSSADWIRLVEAELRDRLCNPAFLAHQGEIGFEAYMGMKCQEVQVALQHLLTKRGSIVGQSSWVTTMDLATDPARVDRDVSAIFLAHAQHGGDQLVLGHTGSRPFANTSTGLDGYRGLGPDNISPEPTLDEIRHVQRRRKEEAVSRALSSVLPASSASAAVVYAQEGLDAIEAFNPSAPVYWSQPAVELRAVLSSPLRKDVQFTLHGKETAEPWFPLEPAAAANVRFLRREINQRANGRLVDFLHLAKVPPNQWLGWYTKIHRVLRTGSLSESDKRALTDGFQLDTEERTRWDEALQVHPNPLAPIIASSSKGRMRSWDAPAPSVDNIVLALLGLGDELRSGRLGAQDGLVEFGGRLLLVRGKLISKFGKHLQQSLDDLGHLSPVSAVPIAAGFSTAAYFGGQAVDSGLESIVVSAAHPDEVYWEEQGVVRAEDVVSQPTGAYFRNEDEIRMGVPIYANKPNPENPLSNEPFRFQKDRIYRVKMTWLGIESPLGNVGLLTPAKDALWPVFRLKTERPSSEVIQAFVRDHKLWRLLAPKADGFSEPMRDGWLYLLELVIRGEFGWQAAERYGLWGDRGRGLYEIRRHTAFVPHTDFPSQGEANRSTPKNEAKPDSEDGPLLPKTLAEVPMEGTPDPVNPTMDLGGAYGGWQELTLKELERVVGLAYLPSGLSPDNPGREQVFREKIHRVWNAVYGLSSKWDVHGNAKNGAAFSNVLADEDFGASLFLTHEDKLADGETSRETIENKLKYPPSLARAIVTGTKLEPHVWVQYRNDWDVPVIPVSHYGQDRVSERLERFFKTETELEREYGRDLDSVPQKIQDDSLESFGALVKHALFVPMGRVGQEPYFQPFVQPVNQAPDAKHRWKASRVNVATIPELPTDAIRDGQYLDLTWYLDHLTAPSSDWKWLMVRNSDRALKTPTQVFQDRVEDGHKSIFFGSFVGRGRVALYQFTLLSEPALTYTHNIQELAPVPVAEIPVDAATIRALQGTAFRINYAKPETAMQRELFDGLPVESSGFLSDRVYEALVSKLWTWVDEGLISADGKLLRMQNIPGWGPGNIFREAFGEALILEDITHPNGLATMRLQKNAGGTPEVRMFPVTGHSFHSANIVDAEETLNEKKEMERVLAEGRVFTSKYSHALFSHVPPPTFASLLERFGGGFDATTPKVQNGFAETFGTGWYVDLVVGGVDGWKPELRYHVRSVHEQDWRREVIDPVDAHVPEEAILPDGTIDLAGWMAHRKSGESLFAHIGRHSKNFRIELVRLQNAQPESLVGAVEIAHYHHRKLPLDFPKVDVADLMRDKDLRPGDPSWGLPRLPKVSHVAPLLEVQDAFGLALKAPIDGELLLVCGDENAVASLDLLKPDTLKQIFLGRYGVRTFVTATAPYALHQHHFGVRDHNDIRGFCRLVAIHETYLFWLLGEVWNMEPPSKFLKALEGLRVPELHIPDNFLDRFRSFRAQKNVQVPKELTSGFDAIATWIFTKKTSKIEASDDHTLTHRPSGSFPLEVSKASTQSRDLGFRVVLKADGELVVDIDPRRLQEAMQEVFDLKVVPGRLEQIELDFLISIYNNDAQSPHRMVLHARQRLDLVKGALSGSTWSLVPEKAIVHSVADGRLETPEVVQNRHEDGVRVFLRGRSAHLADKLRETDHSATIVVLHPFDVVAGAFRSPVIPLLLETDAKD